MLERTGMDSRQSFFLPCGRCVMCRLERSRQWATRCLHEAKMHEESCYITLTYDDAHVPPDGSLKYSDYVSFMRRLRKYVRRRHEAKSLRFYMCGEYGGATGRPHYHALIFGYDFSDKLYFKRIGKFKLFTSAVLGQLWPMGNHLIGAVSFESAAYVARYCMEKITGQGAEAHYGGRVPEFNQMSRGKDGGIGAPFVRKFLSDVYPHGEVVVNGKLQKAPRYYDKLFAKLGGDVDELAYNRAKRARLMNPEEHTDERLFVREQVAIARFSQFNREL